MSVKKIADKIIEDLTDKNVTHTIEKKGKDIIIWLDKENNFGCYIQTLCVKVKLLSSDITIYAEEEVNAVTKIAQKTIKKIQDLMENKVICLEMYKKGKLCSSRLFLSENNQGIPYDLINIKSINYFNPFINEEYKGIEYVYKKQVKKSMKKT